MPGEITHFTSLLCSLALSRSQINQAQRLLSQLQERISGEEASSALNWFRVDMILESTSLTANTKFYALQILESAIKYRWKTLPAEQCNGIKSFVVNLVIARSSQEDTYREQRLFTNKLNVILVQVVKQEWPHNWPSFISDIVNASKTNETLCENNMIILKLLSEEVFDFSRDEMTSAKAKKLKESFNADFSLIFQVGAHAHAPHARSKPHVQSPILTTLPFPPSLVSYCAAVRVHHGQLDQSLAPCLHLPDPPQVP